MWLIFKLLGAIYFPKLLQTDIFVSAIKISQNVKLLYKFLKNSQWMYLSVLISSQVGSSLQISTGPWTTLRVAVMLVPTPHSSGKEADVNEEMAINHRHTVS